MDGLSWPQKNVDASLTKRLLAGLQVWCTQHHVGAGRLTVSYQTSLKVCTGVSESLEPTLTEGKASAFMLAHDLEHVFGTRNELLPLIACAPVFPSYDGLMAVRTPAEPVGVHQ
eukprot:1206162-Pyramimonas_sp.AAC.1